MGKQLWWFTDTYAISTIHQGLLFRSNVHSVNYHHPYEGGVRKYEWFWEVGVREGFGGTLNALCR
jgi:hypothetical protein